VPICTAVSFKSNIVQGLYFVIDSLAQGRNNAQRVTELLKRDITNNPFFGGLLLLICALTFYYFAVLRIDYQKTALLNLAPYPDATEYFAQAKALSNGRWPAIQIGYEELPSRYPPGYPALMLPWLKMLPQAHSVLAPFRTNQTIGLLLLLAVFAFYTYLTMPLTGGFATLLLATLPSFFTFCRSSLSELSLSLFIVLAFMSAYLGFREERRWKLYFSAVLLGLSLNIRIQSLFFAPLLLAMIMLPTRGMRVRWLFHCAAVSVVFLTAASPVLVLNTIQFGSPLKTGYDFWVPYFGEKHLFFSFRYLPRNSGELWRQLTLQPHGYDAVNIFGTGTSFVMAFVLLSCLGVFFIRPSWFFYCAFLAWLFPLVAGLCFLFGNDGRLYVPLLTIMVSIAVLPVTWAANNVFACRRSIFALAIFALFATTCLGYPSRSGYKTRDINRSQAWDALHFSTSPRKPVQFVAQRYFGTEFQSEPGIVLSDIDPVYLNALLPRDFVAAPIDGNHHYKWSYTWRYDQPQALALVQRGLTKSLPIYALFVSKQEMQEKTGRLPRVDGYDWVLIDGSSGEAAILKLTPTS
jgi:4-amino-4-deoxy-L-arabinose transferase-like glycosyltransferase